MNSVKQAINEGEKREVKLDLSQKYELSDSVTKTHITPKDTVDQFYQTMSTLKAATDKGEKQNKLDLE